MSHYDGLQLVLYFSFAFLLAKPLGTYIAGVYQAHQCWGGRYLSGIERAIYRSCRISLHDEMTWRRYLYAMLFFNFLGMIAVYFLQRLQGLLPLNPEGLSSVSSALAWNTAISFTTNTDWQAYAGETTMSYLTQMLAFTTQNFCSAATGMTLLVALARGISSEKKKTLGNFWVDLVRGVVYILLPMAFILAVILVSQGVVQTLQPSQVSEGYLHAQPFRQVIPMGPVASQTAIATLGTNGGGFFNANAAHPFQNPTPLSNFIQSLALILIPMALCYTFGILINDRRQARAILCAMLLLFLPIFVMGLLAEYHGNPQLTALGVVAQGNMEGKETRIGMMSSVLWTAMSTATANGAMNSSLDSYTPLGGAMPLLFMELGEVVFGGVGTGFCGMLMFAIITVFVAGLMVGRTPEYLGKKIEPFEMKMASIAVLIMPVLVLRFTAESAFHALNSPSLLARGSHGFTEFLYAWTSMGNNNGSAFGGLSVDGNLYTVMGGLVMLVARYAVAAAILAIAGALAQKKVIPTTTGTLTTHTPMFVFLLAGITLLLGGLSFLPALCLGPIVEHLYLWGSYAV